jgi:hypothetical protein
MPSTATFTIEDYSGEQSTTQIHVQDITTLNYGATSTDANEIKAAMAAITLGELRRVNLVKTYAESLADVTDPEAQREAKWLVTYRDTLAFLDSPTNLLSNPGYLKTFTFEIPCADFSKLLPNSDQADMSDADIAAFVTEFEANARSPYNNASTATSGWVKVLDIRLVGRNT